MYVISPPPQLYKLLVSQWACCHLTPLQDPPCLVGQKALTFAGLANESNDPKLNIPK